MAEATGDIGLIGLAVMGQNLVLNMDDHGYNVVVFNRTTSKVDDFLEHEAKGTKVQGAHTVQELCAKLKRPRKVMLLVKAGQAVDDFIEQIIPHLEKGDLIIDGGNSHYGDSDRRSKYLQDKGFLFVGSGVSGGEEGARYGPSLMPGGTPEAWPLIQKIFQDIAAKTEEGEPCCDWVGEGGSGHYVKMVHNGIEYGDMQILAEAYDIMKNILKMSYDEMASTFETWNKSELDSFLVEITAKVLAFKDENGNPLVERIRDAAGQKGTGKWTAISALDLGIPVTLVSEAVFARCLSSLKEERVKASKILRGPEGVQFSGDKNAFLDDIKQALYAAKIVSYAQGFMELRAAGKEFGWHLNFGGIALMWRGGCIIRSAFLRDINNAFKTNPDLHNLLLDPFFTKAIHNALPHYRRVASQAILLGVPVPALTSALSFYDGYRSARVPANLLQAQRDFFGAHTYEIEGEPGKWIHTNWTGHGGRVASSTYNA
ncbi:6-phosphogluconate dehydrogenase [Phlyctochytrium arcticum]|nr:6-phosphogluconate dehydrogenase [Phlyctochytrium arcticum]